jgi:YD repeat-containing protein
VPTGLPCLVSKSRPTSVVCTALAGLIFVAGAFVYGQTNNPISMIDNTTTTPVPGVPHDYIQSLNETVNPANGALSIRIKAPTPQERGVNWPTYVFMYDSNQQYQLWPTWSAFTTGSVTGQNLEYLNIEGPPPFATGGLTSQQSSTLPSGNGTTTTYYCNITSGYMFTDPDGGLHALGMAVATPTYTVPANQGDTCGSIPMINAFAGGDIQYKAYIPNPTTAPNTIEVVDTHGDALVTTAVTGNVSTEDVNGNLTTPTTSTTGRTFTVTGQASAGNSTTMTLPGVSGNYQLAWIAGVSPSFTLNLTPVSGTSGCSASPTSFELLGGGYPPARIVVSQVTLPDELFYQFIYDPVYGLLDKVVYPTGAWVEYTWGINPDAEGTAWPNVGTSTTQCELIHDWFAITKRVVSHDGTNADEEQDFSYTTVWPGGSSDPTSTFWTSKTTTVTTKDLLRGTSFQTIYTYSPMLAPPTQPLQGAAVRGDVPVENTITYKDTSGSVLKTVTKTWQSMSLMSAECETLPNGQMSGKFYTYQPYTGFSRLVGLGSLTAPVNPEANWTDLPTDVAEYDYGTLTSCVNPTTTIPSATALRETVTSYKTFTLSPSPLFPWIAPSSGTASSSILLDRPATVQVYSKGTLLSQTNYLYDGAAPTSVADVYGFDNKNYGSGTTPPRGNLTSIQKCTVISSNTCSTFGIISSFAYDFTGQVLTATDPRGYTTTYNYKDTYTNGAPPSGYVTNAYPTTITAPPTGSSTHTTTYQFGYTDGKLWNVTDVENGTTTKYCYFTGGFSGTTCPGSPDPYYRLTGILHPDNGQETITYFDGSPSVSPTVSTSTLLSSTGSPLTKESIYDAFGLETTSLLTSDPDGPDEVYTTYDGLGQVWTKTNPYRSTTNGTSTFFYDALGRKIEEQEQDGSILQTCYDDIPSVPAVANCSAHVGGVTTGNWVDSTDENGNHWKRTSNALGQLMDVMEPNGTTQSPSMETEYTYDAQSNLLLVKQCGALCSSPASNGPISRSFQYDSLSRLLSATNPETGTVGYAYDANSNVVTKTDARSITTSYTYDALNRVVSKVYSSNANGTPLSCYQYDTSSASCSQQSPYWKGRLTNAWTQAQSSSSCSGTAPNFAPVSGSYLTLKSISCYDPMGRPTSAQQQQCIGTTCPAATPYSLGMAYDLAGNLTTLTNSVGAAGQQLTLNNYFDAASRPCLTTATTGNTSWSTNYPGNLFQANPSSTTPGYSAFGGLQNWYMGSPSSTALTGCSSLPSPVSPINVTQGYTNRLWVNSISATGQIP